MDSHPEKPRNVGRISAARDGDRLSSFHDSILSHILSFMPTKCAARTSILSKRWKYVFIDVPKLVFDEKDLSVSGHGTFVNFVNRRLMLCKTLTITKFRLILLKLPDPSVINLWITSLFFRNLKVLEIEENCSIGTPQCPPSEIFGWETLTVLKLGGVAMVLKFPEFVFSPNLKVLDLHNLKIQCQSESCRFDQEGYPLLEDLQLSYVHFICSKDDKALLKLGIFLCTLENLGIVVGEPNLSKIDIDTPQLRHLKYNVWERDEDVAPVQISFCKSEHLVSADLYSEFNTDYLHSELLCNINGVKDLCLSQFEDKDLTYSLHLFANLTHLELTRTEGELTWTVLRSAPNLEVLVCQINFGDLVYFPPADVPMCLAQKLREIRLYNFASEEQCIEADVGLAGFILQHGAMLEKLTLFHPYHVTTDSRMSTLEKLLKLPRRSPKCEIELQREEETVVEEEEEEDGEEM